MRKCGDCQLCCKLLPMSPDANVAGARNAMLDAGVVHPQDFEGMLTEWYKPAGMRCEHQRHGKGCAIYSKRPFGCRVWNCRWLLNDDTADIPRPDHCHYVIDVMPDVIALKDNETGTATEMNCVVVWVDPKYPDAHRDEALRRYLQRRAEKDNMPAIIRWNERDGMALFAPIFDAEKRGEWMERPSMATPGFKGLSERFREAARHGG